jgi:hypothetical protein
MTDKTSSPVSPSRRRARGLRIIGVIVLLLGIAGEGVVYWQDVRSPDFMDDPEMLGYNRAEKRQMGLLFGRQGVMLDNFLDTLKSPHTQSAIIIVATVLVSGGCFYLAALMDKEEKARQ